MKFQQSDERVDWKVVFRGNGPADMSRAEVEEAVEGFLQRFRDNVRPIAAYMKFVQTSQPKLVAAPYAADDGIPF